MLERGDGNQEVKPYSVVKGENEVDRGQTDGSVVRDLAHWGVGAGWGWVLWASGEGHSKRDKGCRVMLGVPGLFNNRKEARRVGAEVAMGEKERNQDPDFGFYTKWNQSVTEGSQQTADKS